MSDVPLLRKEYCNAPIKIEANTYFLKKDVLDALRKYKEYMNKIWDEIVKDEYDIKYTQGFIHSVRKCEIKFVEVFGVLDSQDDSKGAELK